MNQPNINPIGETDNPLLEELKAEAIQRYKGKAVPCHNDWDKALTFNLLGNNKHTLWVNLPNGSTAIIKEK